jgi:hypothetical protein
METQFFGPTRERFTQATISARSTTLNLLTKSLICCSKLACESLNGHNVSENRWYIIILAQEEGIGLNNSNAPVPHIAERASFFILLNKGDPPT